MVCDILTDMLYTIGIGPPRKTVPLQIIRCLPFYAVRSYHRERFKCVQQHRLINFTLHYWARGLGSCLSGN